MKNRNPWIKYTRIMYTNLMHEHRCKKYPWQDGTEYSLYRRSWSSLYHDHGLWGIHRPFPSLLLASSELSNFLFLACLKAFLFCFLWLTLLMNVPIAEFLGALSDIFLYATVLSFWGKGGWRKEVKELGS